MNTHQIYLKTGVDNLKSDVERIKRAGYIASIKLVRGAYIVNKRAYAKTNGLEDIPFRNLKIRLMLSINNPRNSY